MRCISCRFLLSSSLLSRTYWTSANLQETISVSLRIQLIINNHHTTAVAKLQKLIVRVIRINDARYRMHTTVYYFNFGKKFGLTAA